MFDTERFWGHVGVSDGCWEWQSTRDGRGYGVFYIEGRRYRAHRVMAYLLGMIPSYAAEDSVRGSDLILHACDNKICVNPAHLEVGTQSKNIKDAYARGLKEVNFPPSPGEKNGQAKITADIVRAIRQQREEGLTLARIAEEHGISFQQVSKIVHRQRWAHIQ